MRDQRQEVPRSVLAHPRTKAFSKPSNSQAVRNVLAPKVRSVDTPKDEAPEEERSALAIIDRRRARHYAPTRTVPAKSRDQSHKLEQTADANKCESSGAERICAAHRRTNTRTIQIKIQKSKRTSEIDFKIDSSTWISIVKIQNPFQIVKSEKSKWK